MQPIALQATQNSVVSPSPILSHLSTADFVLNWQIPRLFELYILAFWCCCFSLLNIPLLSLKIRSLKSFEIHSHLHVSFMHLQDTSQEQFYREVHNPILGPGTRTGAREMPCTAQGRRQPLPRCVRWRTYVSRSKILHKLQYCVQYLFKNPLWRHFKLGFVVPAF